MISFTASTRDLQHWRVARRDPVIADNIRCTITSDFLTRKYRNPKSRDQFEQEWLIEKTWCEHCIAAELGINNPSECEENGHVFIEGICRCCGK